MTQPQMPKPILLPLGDRALLVRFDNKLTDRANRAAIGFARELEAVTPAGAEEIVPNLVSVLIRFDPAVTDPEALAGEIRLRLATRSDAPAVASHRHKLAVRFGGADGPDLEEVAAKLRLDVPGFIAAHNKSVLRVLATGFAPGFVYCGFHPSALEIPRRGRVRAKVPPGTVLFAAGQTAICATPVPTGWHVIGRTDFLNFNASAIPPTQLRAGDHLAFEEAKS